MTREERTELIKHLQYNLSIGADYVITDEDANEIIKALEQEPCEDAISRADMLDAIGHGTTYTSEELQRIIKGLLPVNPQPKKGHWIGIDEKSAVCSCCCRNNTLYGDYCKWCGTKMKSEDMR